MVDTKTATPNATVQCSPKRLNKRGKKQERLIEKGSEKDGVAVHGKMGLLESVNEKERKKEGSKITEWKNAYLFISIAFELRVRMRRVECVCAL